MNKNNNIEEILSDLDKRNIKKIKIAVADIDGVLRGKYVHIDKFKSIVKNGFSFCSVVFAWDSQDLCYSKCDFAGWQNGYPDIQVKVDLNTFREIPWENNQPFLLADFYDSKDDKPLNICPRQTLRKVIARAEKLGLYCFSGCEFEWFNFKESPESIKEKSYTDPSPLTPGMFGYSLLRAGRNIDFFTDIMDLLEKFKVPIEGLHTETGPGVYEAAIKFCSALEAADRAILFKSSVKEIAMKYDIMPSFMARWSTELPGCSGHIHQSLCDSEGNNLFYEKNAKNGMSDIFNSYLAGLIKYTPSFLALMAPTINSYKRLVEGFWAPTRSTWGHDNRTCAFRVISGGPSSTRVEVRVPGADMNPYLSMAASLGAGLLGIEEKLSLNHTAITGNGYEDRTAEAFPANLNEAANKLQNSQAAINMFGEPFVNHYANSRQWECEQFQKSVTDWELKRYFEII